MVLIPPPSRATTTTTTIITTTPTGVWVFAELWDTPSEAEGGRWVTTPTMSEQLRRPRRRNSDVNLEEL